MMAKYLPQFGWETYVLSGGYGLGHHLRDENMNIGKIVPENRIVRVDVGPEEETKYLQQRGWVGKLRDFITIEKAFPPGHFDKLWD